MLHLPCPLHAFCPLQSCLFMELSEDWAPFSLDLQPVVTVPATRPVMAAEMMSALAVLVIRCFLLFLTVFAQRTPFDKCQRIRLGNLYCQRKLSLVPEKRKRFCAAFGKDLRQNILKMIRRGIKTSSHSSKGLLGKLDDLGT